MPEACPIHQLFAPYPHETPKLHKILWNTSLSVIYIYGMVRKPRCLWHALPFSYFLLALVLGGCELLPSDGDRSDSDTLVGTEGFGTPTCTDGVDWALPQDTDRAPDTGLFRSGGSTLDRPDDPDIDDLLNTYGLTFSWADLNPSENTHDLSALLSVLDEAQSQNKKIVIRIKNHVVDRASPWGSGEQYVPQWVLDQAEPAIFYTREGGPDDFIKVAAPWDQELTQYYLSFIEEVGEEGVISHPATAGIYIHGFSTSFGEEFWLDTAYINDAEAAGMTATTLYNAFDERFTAWAAAAGEYAGRLAWVGAGWIDGYGDIQDAIDARAAELGFGYRSGGFERYNAPLEDAVRDRGDGMLVYDETSQKVAPNPEFPFGGPGRFLGGEDENFYEADYYREWIQSTIFVESLAGTKYVWVNYDESILLQDLPILRWFALTAGKGSEHRADAAAWLRESRIRYPEINDCRTVRNLEIGLLQTNASDTPAVEPFSDRGTFYTDCDGHHYDYLARSTAVASGIGSFDFAVDSAYSPQMSGTVVIAVTYRDAAGVSWRITAPGGVSETIINGGSGSLKTVRFTVGTGTLKDTDGRYRFSIEHVAGGDLTVRMARIVF